MYFPDNKIPSKHFSAKKIQRVNVSEEVRFAYGWWVHFGRHLHYLCMCLTNANKTWVASMLAVAKPQAATILQRHVVKFGEGLAPVHLRGVRWGRGQSSVQTRQVLPHL